MNLCVNDFQPRSSPHCSCLAPLWRTRRSYRRPDFPVRLEPKIHPVFLIEAPQRANVRETRLAGPGSCSCSGRMGPLRRQPGLGTFQPAALSSPAARSSVVRWDEVVGPGRSSSQPRPPSPPHLSSLGTAPYVDSDDEGVVVGTPNSTHGLLSATRRYVAVTSYLCTSIGLKR